MKKSMSSAYFFLLNRTPPPSWRNTSTESIASCCEEFVKMRLRSGAKIEKEVKWKKRKSRETQKLVSKCFGPNANKKRSKIKDAARGAAVAAQLLLLAGTAGCRTQAVAQHLSSSRVGSQGYPWGLLASIPNSNLIRLHLTWACRQGNRHHGRIEWHR